MECSGMAQCGPESDGGFHGIRRDSSAALSESHRHGRDGAWRSVLVSRSLLIDRLASPADGVLKVDSEA